VEYICSLIKVDWLAACIALRVALCRRPLLADKAGTARFGGTLARGPVCIVEDLNPQSDPGFLLNANPQPDMKKIQLFLTQQPPSPVFPIRIH
jgi:hypothetical protein